MNKTQDLLNYRESLDKICKIPKDIISVYTLEQHVWAGSHLDIDAFRLRKPELKTIQEFQIDPVRHFLNDIFRKMAAPYRPDQRGEPIGQGYWIQAEFGSGKSPSPLLSGRLVPGIERCLGNCWQCNEFSVL